MKTNTQITDPLTTNSNFPEPNPVKTRREKLKGGEMSAARKLPALTARAFIPSDDDAIELVLRADGDYEGNVWIAGVGDDGSTDDLPLESAEVIGLGPVEVEQSKIKNVKLSAGQPLRVRLRFRQPGKYAVRATLL